MRKRAIHIHTDALPPRTSKTMGEAIALSSPNGSMSNRAKQAAVQRLGTALFGPNGLQKGSTPQPGKKETLLRQAAELRGLANRGMSPARHNREAQRLEEEAATLDANLSLWRYNKITGLWVHERTVVQETAQQWLNVFKSDSPDESFKVSAHRPTGKP